MDITGAGNHPGFVLGHAGARIIAISGALEGRFLIAARLLGSDAPLGKPIRAEALLANVAEVLTARRCGEDKSAATTRLSAFLQRSHPLNLLADPWMEFVVLPDGPDRWRTIPLSDPNITPNR
jgi:hypothetical protein